MSLSLFRNVLRHSARIAVLVCLLAASALATQAQVVFSPPKNVSNSSGNTQSQQIAVDANGNANLVWADNSLGNYAIFFSRSSDGGNTFSMPRSISKHAQSAASSPVIAVDSAGNVSVAWTETSPDGSANFIYFSHSSDGVTFTNPHNISGDAGTATGPQMAVEANGNVNVVWADTSLGNSEVFFSRSTNGGTSFSTPVNISNDAADSVGPQIGVDPSGNINIAWDDIVQTFVSHVFFSRSTDGGATFSTPIQATNSNSGFVQLKVGGNGNIYLLWIQENPNSSSAVFSRSTDGGATFSTPVSAVAVGGGFVDGTSMALDPSGNNIGVVANLSLDEFREVGFTHSSDGGATFFGSSSSELASVSRNAQIAMDAIGRFDISYIFTGQLIGGPPQTPCFCFSQSADGNEFSGASISSYLPSSGTVMGVDGGGNVYVAWLQSATTGGNADVFFSRGTVPPFSFTVSATRAVGGFDSTTGTVKLVAPAPAGGAVISLTSSNSSVANVPASVTVPGGESSATFPISTSEVTSFTSVTITASYNGTNTASLGVEPLFRLSLFGDVGGGPVFGEVFMDEPAPSGGLVITLSSTDPSVASVPASVTIPAGNTQWSFNITTSAVVTTTTVTITGTSNGFSQSVPLTVRATTLQALAVSPLTATGGANAAGLVLLNGRAPAGGAVVSLSSSDPSASVPASVTIPADSTSVWFTITTNPGSATTNVTITASYNGGTRNATLTVQPLILQPFVGTAIGGGGTASLFICMNVPVPSPTVVSISSSNPSIASVPASVTVPQGPQCTEFNINTSPVSANTDVTISESFNGVTRTATLTVQPIMLIVLTGRGDVVSGSSALGAVVLNGPAPAGGIVVSLTSSNPSVASVPATVTIPQGSQAQNFTITGGPITAQTNVTITASYQGVTRSETIVVHF